MLFLIPVFLVLWLIGWSLYITGEPTKPSRNQQKKKENVHVAVILPTETAQEIPQTQ